MIASHEPFFQDSRMSRSVCRLFIDIALRSRFIQLYFIRKLLLFMSSSNVFSVAITAHWLPMVFPVDAEELVGTTSCSRCLRSKVGKESYKDCTVPKGSRHVSCFRSISEWFEFFTKAERPVTVNIRTRAYSSARNEERVERDRVSCTKRRQRCGRVTGLKDGRCSDGFLVGARR